MKTGKFFNGWSFSICLLAIIIVAGGVFIILKINQSPGIEITLAPENAVEGQIYVSGSVNNPGLYPLYSGDSLDDIIRAAGGLKNGADLNAVELAVAPIEKNMPQKIDINRAEAWLLEALPGVGEAKAGAVIAYREQNGFFRDINELLNVPGFGESILDQIKNLITVRD